MDDNPYSAPQRNSRECGVTAARTDKSSRMSSWLVGGIWSFLGWVLLEVVVFPALGLWTDRHPGYGSLTPAERLAENIRSSAVQTMAFAAALAVGWVAARMHKRIKNPSHFEE
jgi:hypothetical protein